ncbi:MAG: sulfatase-like hydrolase/transferase, partial [Planctomycetota bacterium]
MPSRRPNIVITFSDDQPAYACGAAGNTILRTPAQDALAARGTRFARAWHGGSHIGAVCAPNRAMLFTGRYQWQIPNVIKGWWEPGCERFEAPEPDPACTPLLGEILRRNGYHTFATGKWHNMPFSFHRNFADG